MSYIRCLSNPEGLYIYETFGGTTEISVGAEPVLSMPHHVFVGILKRWYKRQDEEVRYRGAKMTEDLIPGKGVQVALRYKRWQDGEKVECYPVTWVYICAQFKWAKENCRR